MTHAKVEVNVGGLSFSAEGEPQWLAEQLDKILKAAAQKPESHPSQSGPLTPAGEAGAEAGSVFSETLGSYIESRRAEDNQVKRFLATADWLRRRGETVLTTRGVTAALKNADQRKLTNPSDCLNQNVVKGYCQKAGRSFFITPDGLKSLGYKP